MGAPGLTPRANRTSLTAAIGGGGTRSQPPLVACGVGVLLAFAGLWVTTLLGAVIGTAVPALAPGARPHPTLHGSLNELVSITATNGRVLSAPFLLALFHFPDHRRTRQLGDVFVAGVLEGNALRVGLALGRWQARLLPYVPQLPLEWLAAAVAAAAWLTLRTGAQRQTALAYLAAVLVLVAAAAAVETLATPHIPARREEPVSSECRRGPSPARSRGGHQLPLADPVGCRRPVSPTAGRTASRSTDVSLPLAGRLGSASGRRPGVSGFVNHRIPQGGNQR